MLLTVSCAKKVVKEEAPVQKQTEEESLVKAREAEKMKQAEMERQRKLEEERLREEASSYPTPMAPANQHCSKPYPAF